MVVAASKGRGKSRGRGRDGGKCRGAATARVRGHGRGTGSSIDRGHGSTGDVTAEPEAKAFIGVKSADLSNNACLQLLGFCLCMLLLRLRLELFGKSVLHVNYS